MCYSPLLCASHGAKCCSSPFPVFVAQSRLCVERNSREVLQSVGVALAPALSIGHRSQRGENSCHDYMSSSVVSEKGRIQYQSLERKLGLPVCTTSDHIPSCVTEPGTLGVLLLLPLLESGQRYEPVSVSSGISPVPG